MICAAVMGGAVIPAWADHFETFSQDFTYWDGNNQYGGSGNLTYDYLVADLDALGGQGTPHSMPAPGRSTGSLKLAYKKQCTFTKGTNGKWHCRYYDPMDPPTIDYNHDPEGVDTLTIGGQIYFLHY